MRKTYILMVLLVLVGAVAVLWLSMESKGVQTVACTKEAKLCPDGSAVGRTGPNCEFAACPEVVPTSVVTAGDIMLGVGQKGKVGDLDITVNAFVGDSRCPIDVQCIWAGELKMNATFTSASKTETRDISTIDAPYLFAGRSISIGAVTPIPESIKKIRVEDYRVTFHVAIDTKKDGGNLGTITGIVTLSPTCPVERMPPDPLCAPKPYQTKIEVFTTDGSELVKSTQTASDGSFTLTLPFGDYNIQAGGGTIHSNCSPVAVRLQTATTAVDISCDTGIR